MADVLNLMNYVQQQGEIGRKRGTQQREQRLGGQIVQGDPEAYQQLATTNPDAADRYQQSGDAQLRRMEGLISYMKATEAKDGPQAAQAVWVAQGVPYVRQFAQGTEPTANWAEAKPMLAQLEAKIAQAKAGSAVGQVQSTQILANGNIGVVTRTGQVVDTGQKASPTTQLINEPGQTPYLVTTGRGQVGVTTGIGPGGAPSVNIEGVSTERAQQISQAVSALRALGMPDDQIDDFVRKQAYGQPQGVTPGGAPVSIPSGVSLSVPSGPVPQRNPTAAEVEAAKTSAREQVELGYLPQRGQIEAQNAGATQAAKTAAELSFANQQAQAAGATEEAKQNAQTRAELSQLLPKVQGESQRAVQLIDGVLNHPGREAATGLSSVNPLNMLPGSPAYDFRVRMEQLRGVNFLQAFQSLKGGGAITETEGKKAEQAIARLDAAQSEGEFIKALQELRDVAAELPSSIQRRIMATGPNQPQGPSRPTTEAEYNALPRGALFIDPDDGKTYRKP